MAAIYHISALLYSEANRWLDTHDPSFNKAVKDDQMYVQTHV
jgi:hypothetical protein